MWARILSDAVVKDGFNATRAFFFTMLYFPNVLNSSF